MVLYVVHGGAVLQLVVRYMYIVCNMVCLLLFVGSVPSEIGQLTSLVGISLIENSLAGTSGDV